MNNTVICLQNIFVVKSVDRPNATSSSRDALYRGVARILQRGGGGGGVRGVSHWVKQYRHGVFATEYCRLFAYKKGFQRGGGG